MRKFVVFIFFLSFSAQGLNILDILEGKDHNLTLQKELKKDIGSLFPVLSKPHLFLKAFDSGDFVKSLQIWERSLRGTSFAKSSTGQALYSYLLFQNRFEILSLLNLLNKSQPKKIDPIVGNLWKRDIKKSHPIWNFFSFRMNPKWLGFFDPEVLFKTGAKASWDFRSKKDQDYIKFLLGLSISDQIDSFSLEWSFILSLIQQGELPTATKLLAWLISKTKDQNRKDKIHLNIGRLLADINEKEAALSYYKKVKKISYFWLLAQEEMSWISFNRGNYRKAYAKASAFLYPQIQKEISPYMFLILSLSQLENCDYKGFFLSLSHFKSFFSKRMEEIDAILASGKYKVFISKLVNFYNSKKPYYTLSSFNVPYLFKKDSRLKNSIRLFNYMQNQKPRRLKNSSLEKKEKKLLIHLETKIKKRVNSLLKKEKENILFVLQNFHLAEAELLYQHQGFHSLGSFSSRVENAYPFTAIQLVYDKNPFFIFPFNPNEIWLDEIPYYQSGFVKKCPKGSYVL